MTGSWGRILRLTVVGGLAFWVANLAISLTPIAAEYRAALSIPYVPMLVEALAGGLLIALGVSWALVRQPGWLPKTSPLGQALLLSLVALVLVTLGIELPSKILVHAADPMRYFLVGAAFNTVRLLALGLAISRTTIVSMFAEHIMGDEHPNARLDPEPRRSTRTMTGRPRHRGTLSRIPTCEAQH